MAAPGDEAAIREMVKAEFAAHPVDRIVGRPSHATIRLMTEQLAPVTATFDTTQWGGGHGCLVMALGGAKYRAVIGDSTVAVDPMAKPAANATFEAADDDTEKEKKRKATATL